ncbi:formimidoylglutamate deiminase [Oligoflexus tunisiensis]|uniref:formimidoylglutamate deiminase n=1 Tax=Oligoflexus tunisiensis TaxID=708132 RepID=UPI000B0BB82B|nr:formimidoylglutamate deiminase [Oligoflexus tunisiensis]
MTQVLQFKAGYVQDEWITPCFVSLDDLGRISAIGSEHPAQAITEKHEGYLLPGFANGHSHSFQYLMSGMAERLERGHESDDFWSWREKMYQLAAVLDPEQLLDLTTRFYQSLLEYGYTSVCEFHYLHHDKSGHAYAQPATLSISIMEAARRAGIRLTLVPVYYHQAAPGKPIQPRQRRFYCKDTDEYLGLLEHIANANRKLYPEVLVGYGVHSMRAAPPRDIKTILGTHWALGPAHFHVSEQSSDALAFEQAYHCRAVDWLYDNVPLSDHHNLVHATHINTVEIKKLVASQATVVLCPSTEGNLGDGIFPFPEYFNQGGNFCIGTDSHVSLCPFGEARYPEIVHRLFMEKRNLLCQHGALDSGQILFDHVQTSGRRALGLTGEAFDLGQPFDAIVLDGSHDRLVERPLSHVLGIAMYAGDQNLIDAVYVQGIKQVSGGQHLRKRETVESFRKVMRQVTADLTL